MDASNPLLSQIAIFARLLEISEKDEDEVDDEKKEEAAAEGDDEEDKDDGKLGDSVDDVVEHEDEDAEGGKLLEVGEQVEPGHGEDERPDRPPPALPRKEI